MGGIYTLGSNLDNKEVSMPSFGRGKHSCQINKILKASKMLIEIVRKSSEKINK